MVLAAAVDVLLYRYTGESDLSVGTTMLGRTRPSSSGSSGCSSTAANRPATPATSLRGTARASRRDPGGLRQPGRAVREGRRAGRRRPGPRPQPPLPGRRPAHRGQPDRSRSTASPWNRSPGRPAGPASTWRSPSPSRPTACAWPSSTPPTSTTAGASSNSSITSRASSWRWPTDRPSASRRSPSCAPRRQRIMAMGKAARTARSRGPVHPRRAAPGSTPMPSPSCSTARS